MSLSTVASPRATEPKRITDSTSSVTDAFTISVSAESGSSSARSGAMAACDSTTRYTYARPTARDSMTPSRSHALSASWTEPKL